MMKREDVLMEALPYIQQFHGKTIVIKLGGHAMVDPTVLENAIKDAVLLHYVGIRVVLVHGGGPGDHREDEGTRERVGLCRGAASHRF